MNLFYLMYTAVDAARRAGRIIRRASLQESVAQQEAPTEAVTATDPAPERPILETIRKAFQPPDDANAGIHDERSGLPAAEGHP